MEKKELISFYNELGIEEKAMLLSSIAKDFAANASAEVFSHIEAIDQGWLTMALLSRSSKVRLQNEITGAEIYTIAEKPESVKSKEYVLVSVLDSTQDEVLKDM